MNPPKEPCCRLFPRRADGRIILPLLRAAHGLPLNIFTYSLIDLLIFRKLIKRALEGLLFGLATAAANLYLSVQNN